MSGEGRSGVGGPGVASARGGTHCPRWPIAICSWSLRLDVEGVSKAMDRLGVAHVNLALRPALREGGEGYLDAVRHQRWKISAATIGFPQEDYTSLESIRATGGIVPDAHWPTNRTLFERAVAITSELGVPYLTMHAGFIEDGDAAQSKRIRDRLALLADISGNRGITLLMETGQERAAHLREFLQGLGHPMLGVNFDPANMILYDKGDPAEAVHTLGGWIKHVHIKDAIRTKTPGAWGTEVPWGEGQVGCGRFLRALNEIGFDGALAIEREAGDDRLGDIARAVERLRAEMGI